MVDLPAVVRCVLFAPVAWLYPSVIAELMGADVDLVRDQCCDLNVSGWLDVVDADPEPLVMLSPDAMQRLGVELGDEDSPTGYVPIEREDDHPRDLPLSEPDQVVDPQPTPLEWDEAREELETYLSELLHWRRSPLPGLIDRVPWPTVLYMGLPGQWSELKPEWGPCVDCRSREARRQATPHYDEQGKPFIPPAPLDRCCLRCMTWGWDRHFRPKEARGRKPA
ncbi:MAG TPA: hypothetical protein VN719_09425 [Gemmatimonadales bacterium]|nr:hypothetical protein [Gemmatimonadales bacterium]